MVDKSKENKNLEYFIHINESLKFVKSDSNHSNSSTKLNFNRNTSIDQIRESYQLNHPVSTRRIISDNTLSLLNMASVFWKSKISKGNKEI